MGDLDYMSRAYVVVCVVNVGRCSGDGRPYRSEIRGGGVCGKLLLLFALQTREDATGDRPDYRSGLAGEVIELKLAASIGLKPSTVCSVFMVPCQKTSFGRLTRILTTSDLPI